MSKSLQDQLMKSGLIDSKKAKEIGKEKRQSKKKQKLPKNTVIIDENEEKRKQAIEDKREKDRLLNLKLKEDADKKALAAQVKQLVNHYKLKMDRGEQEYNFKDGKLIKKIYVDKQSLDEIAKGRLCIARVEESYTVIPRPIAERIRERDPSAVVVYNDRSQEAQINDGASDDAYYAQFEIPDDLHW